MTSWPRLFFTVTENFGGLAGVGAKRGLTWSGDNGGASTGLTADLSSDIAQMLVDCLNR